MILPFVVGRVRIEWRRLRRDRHAGPHPMKNGGCYCLCEACVPNVNGMYRCACPRCNQDCAAIGRLGGWEHRLIEDPPTAPPARRWYWA